MRWTGRSSPNYTSLTNRLRGVSLWSTVYFSTMVEMQCVITGQVQGVAYRAYVQEAATELGVLGCVRNCPSGAVEVVAQGDPETLKLFIEYLHEGSLMAVVEGVAVEWRHPSKTFSDFSMLH